MNHIRRLQMENAALRQQLRDVTAEVIRVQGYYLSQKFHAHDYAYVRTDILPRLDSLYSLASQTVES